MKMKKSLVALCLSAGLLACAGYHLCRCQFRSTKYQCCPAIPAAALQQLTWTPVDQSKPSQPSFLLAANPECTGNYWPGCRL
jgi:maltose operon protein